VARPGTTIPAPLSIVEKTSDRRGRLAVCEDRRSFHGGARASPLRPLSPLTKECVAHRRPSWRCVPLVNQRHCRVPLQGGYARGYC
jgi:hypothetical protein